MESCFLNAAISFANGCADASVKANANNKTITALENNLLNFLNFSFFTHPIFIDRFNGKIIRLLTVHRFKPVFI